MLFSDSFLILSVIFFPMLLALLFIVKPFRFILEKLFPFTAFPALALAVYMESGFTVRIPWLFLEAQFGLDATARVFLFFTALLWSIAAVYSFFYIKGKGRIQYYVSFLCALSGNLGLICAQDVFSFYFLFALMSFASYGLVIHQKSEDSFLAGKVYIILVVIGEAFVFSGLLLMSYATGTIYILDAIQLLASSEYCHRVILFMFIGFGVKAGALPLHVWLPLAHPVAPTPASAVLSGAMIKAGLFGWLRFLPLGLIAIDSWGWVFVIFGISAAIGSALIGLTQIKAKAVLAYSSISQMGMMMILIGIALMVPDMWTKIWTMILLYALHHAMAKGALFLSVGLAPYQMKSLGLKIIQWLAMIIPMLAIIGFPWTSGALAKGGVKLILKKVKDDIVYADIISLCLTISAMTTTLLLFRFTLLMFDLNKEQKSMNASVWGQFASWIVCVWCVVLIPFLMNGQNVISFKGLESLSMIYWKSLIPLIIGMALSMSVIYFKWSNPLKIPQGDILVVYRQIINTTLFNLKKCVRYFDQGLNQCVKVIGLFSQKSDVESQRIIGLMNATVSWRFFGIVFFSFVILFIYYFMQL